MALDLVAYDDPILYTPAKPFDFSQHTSDSIREMVEGMTRVMQKKGGIGLSACQVGLPHRMFIMNSDPITAVFNPRISAVLGDETEVDVMDEGCLSYPGFYMKVARPKKIRVTYQDHNGENFTRVFVDMTARVFQHEMAHLDGKAFFAGSSRLKLKMAADRSRKKFRRNYELNKLMKRAEQHVS